MNDDDWHEDCRERPTSISWHEDCSPSLLAQFLQGPNLGIFLAYQYFWHEHCTPNLGTNLAGPPTSISWHEYCIRLFWRNSCIANSMPIYLGMNIAVPHLWHEYCTPNLGTNLAGKKPCPISWGHKHRLY